MDGLLKQDLRLCGFDVDNDKAVQTRWGLAWHGSYDDMPARAIVLNAGNTSASSCGYNFDGHKVFNLKQSSNLVSGLHGMAQGKCVKALKSGTHTYIVDDFKSTVGQAMEKGLLQAADLVHRGELTVEGSKVLSSMQQIMETCHNKGILHLEIGCDTLVIVPNCDGYAIRALAAPSMQLVADRQCKGYVPYGIRCSSPAATPPEMQGPRVILEEVTLATTTYQLGVAFGDMFLGGIGMVQGPESFAGFKPECVGHLLAGMLQPDPQLRLDPDWMRGHFASFCRDYGRQGDFLCAVDRSIWMYVKGKEYNAWGAALDKLDMATALGARNVTLLPGGYHIALAMEFHTPLTAWKGSTRTFHDNTRPELWQLSRIILAVRHMIEHPESKVSYKPLVSTLGLKSHDRGEFKAALIETTFQELTWQVWKTGLLPECLKHIMSSELKGYYCCPLKQQLDGRCHKPDNAHSQTPKSVDVDLKLRIESLRRLDDQWTARLLQEYEATAAAAAAAAAAENEEVLLDLDEGQKTSQAAPTVARSLSLEQQLTEPCMLAAGAGGDPCNSTGDELAAELDASNRGVMYTMHRHSSTDGSSDATAAILVLGDSSAPVPGSAPASDADADAIGDELATAMTAVASAAATTLGSGQVAASGLMRMPSLDVTTAAGGLCPADCQHTGQAESMQHAISLTHPAKGVHLAKGSMKRQLSSGRDIGPASKFDTSARALQQLLTGKPQDLDGLHVIPGVDGGCGLGTYMLLFRHLLLSQSLQLQKVGSMARSPLSIAALMQWHMTDQSSTLEAHKRQLATALEVLVIVPYGGPTSCRLVSMFEACKQAVQFSASYTANDMAGRLAMERLYGGNPPCRVAGALLSCVQLWGTRKNGKYKCMEVVKEAPCVQHMLALLDAIDTRNSLQELRLMSDCSHPLTWSLWVSSRLAVGHATQEQPSLHMLQEQAARQLLLELLASAPGTKIALADMAQQLLFQKTPVGSLQVQGVFASDRVLAKLRQDVAKVCPEVTLEQALKGHKLGRGSVGLCSLLVELGIPSKGAVRANAHKEVLDLPTRAVLQKTTASLHREDLMSWINAGLLQVPKV